MEERRREKDLDNFQFLVWTTGQIINHSSEQILEEKQMLGEREKGEESRLPILDNYLMGKIVNKKPTNKVNVRL